ncbi:hypothetical protein SLE2022_158640 [Rubroshorea leprosula]
MDDNTVSVSSRRPNLKTSWYLPIGIMSDVRLCNILRQAESELHVERKEIQPPENTEIVKHSVLEQGEGEFGKLPLDTLFAIGKCLVLPDYVNFRSGSDWQPLQSDGQVQPWKVLKVIILFYLGLCYLEKVTVFAPSSMCGAKNMPWTSLITN